jgi:hypothetical protein
MEYFVENDASITKVSVDKDTYLAKHVDSKVLVNGDEFFGVVDVITGELVHGLLISASGQEKYEGPFLDGKRHGCGAICMRTDGSKKFVGTFTENCFCHGTLITKEFTYTGDFDRGSFESPTFEGHGILALHDKTVYEGSFRESQFEGYGILTSSNTDRYNGRFSHGLKCGLGTMLYQNGSTYSGHWELDLKHGRGILASPDGNRIYSGDFQFDFPHGVGTMILNNNIEMKGLWDKGRPADGPGWRIIYREKGLIYKGDTICGRPHGSGSLLRLPSEKNLQSSVLYCGNFLCGLPSSDVLEDRKNNIVKDFEVHEEGSDVTDTVPLTPQCNDSEFLSPNNVKTESVDQQDKRWVLGVSKILTLQRTFECPITKIRLENSADNSERILTLFDESKFICKIDECGKILRMTSFVDGLNNSFYTGDFEGGLKHGYGCEKYEDGTSYKGYFRNGWRDGMGELIDIHNNIIYKGSWINDKHHGKGFYNYQEGSLFPGFYHGSMKNDQRHGRGKHTTPDGITYEGDWCNGVPQFGDWVITYNTGVVFLGSAQFLDSKNPPVPMGFGSEREPDGSFFTGNFLNGKRHGEGYYLLSSGASVAGHWEHGELITATNPQS